METLQRIGKLLWPALASAVIIVAIVLLGTALGIEALLLYFSGYVIGGAFGVWGSLYYCRREKVVSPLPVLGGAGGGWFGSALGGLVTILAAQADNPDLAATSPTQAVSEAIVSVLCSAICGVPGLIVGGLLGAVAMGLRALWLLNDQRQASEPNVPYASTTAETSPKQMPLPEPQEKQPLPPRRETAAAPLADGRPPRRPPFLVQALWNLWRELDAVTWVLVAIVVLMTGAAGALMPSSGSPPSPAAAVGKGVAMIAVVWSMQMIPLGIVAAVITLRTVVENAPSPIGELRLWIGIGPPRAVKIVFATAAAIPLLGGLAWAVAMFFMNPPDPSGAEEPAIFLHLLCCAFLVPAAALLMSLRRLALGTDGLNLNNQRNILYQEIASHRWHPPKSGRDSQLELRFADADREPLRLLINEHFAPHVDAHLRYHLRETAKAHQQSGNAKGIVPSIAPEGRDLCVLKVADGKVEKQYDLPRDQFDRFIKLREHYFNRDYGPPAAPSPFEVEIDLLLLSATEWTMPLAYVSQRTKAKQSGEKHGGSLRFPIPLDCDFAWQLYDLLAGDEGVVPSPCAAFVAAMDALGGQIISAVIVDLREAGVAELRVQVGDHEHVVQVNACDAVPLAAFAGAPLLVQPEALRCFEMECEPLSKQCAATSFQEGPQYNRIQLEDRQIRKQQAYTFEEYDQFFRHNEQAFGHRLKARPQGKMLPFDLQAICVSTSEPSQWAWLNELDNPWQSSAGSLSNRICICFGASSMARLWHAISGEGSSALIFSVLAELIGESGGKIPRVSIEGLRNEQYVCQLHITHGDKITAIESGAYTALAMAWITGAPLEVASEVIEQLQADGDFDDLLQQGYDLTEAEQYADAVAAFDKAIELNSSDSRAYFARAQVYFQHQQDWRRAHDDLTRLIGMNDAGDLLYRWRATVRDIMGDTAGAIEDLSAALNIDPDNRLFLYQRGSLKALLNDWEGAIADLNAAVRLDPNFARSYRARGIVYRALGNQDLAKREFQRAEELEQDREE